MHPTLKFTPFPVLTTERLVLKRITEDDWNEILFLRSDPTVNRYIERPPERQTRSQEDALRFIKEIQSNVENNHSLAWGITLKDAPNIIGSICLWNFSADKSITEVGYDLRPEFHGKGIMGEALERVLEYGFIELKVEQIEAFTHRDNMASKKLLTTHGFHLAENRSDKDNPFYSVYEQKNTRL